MDKTWVFKPTPSTSFTFHFRTLFNPNFPSRRPKHPSSSSSFKPLSLSNSNSNGKCEDLELLSTKECSDGSIMFRFGDSSEIDIAELELEKQVELSDTHVVIDDDSCNKEENVESVEEMFLIGEDCEELSDVEVERQLAHSEPSGYVEFDFPIIGSDSQLSSSKEEFNGDAAKDQNLDIESGGDDHEFDVVSLDEGIEHCEEDSSSVDKLGIEGLKPVDEIEPSDAVKEITDDSNGIIEIPTSSETELRLSGTTLNSDSLKEITVLTDDVQSSSIMEEPDYETTLNSAALTNDVQRSNVKVVPIPVSIEAELQSGEEDALMNKLEMEGLKPVDESEPSDAAKEIIDDEGHINGITEILVPSEVELQITGTILNSDSLEDITNNVQSTSSSVMEIPVPIDIEQQSDSTLLSSDASEEITSDVQRISNITVDPVPSGVELQFNETCLNSNALVENAEQSSNIKETCFDSDDLEEITDADQSSNYNEVPVPSATELEFVRTLNSDASEEITDEERNGETTEVSVPSALELQFVGTPLNSDSLEEINDVGQNNKTTEVSVPSFAELEPLRTQNSDALEEIIDVERNSETTEVLVPSAAESQFNSDALEDVSGNQQTPEDLVPSTAELQFIGTPLISDGLEEELQSIGTPLNSGTLEEISNDEQTNNIPKEVTDVLVQSAEELQFIDSPSDSDSSEEISNDEQRTNVPQETISSSDVLEEITVDVKSLLPSEVYLLSEEITLKREEILPTGVFLASSTASLPHPHKVDVTLTLSLRIGSVLLTALVSGRLKGPLRDFMPKNSSKAVKGMCWIVKAFL